MTTTAFSRSARWIAPCVLLSAQVALAQSAPAPAEPPEAEAPAPAGDDTPDAAPAETPAAETPDAETPDAEVPAAEPAPEAAPAFKEVKGPAAPEPTPQRRVAVLDLKASDNDAPVANALASVLTAELGRRDDVTAVSRNEVRALLEQQSTAAMLGCESEKCAADLAKVLDADAIVAGSVDFLDGAHVVSLSYIDPAGAVETRRLEWTWRGPTAELVTLAGPAVHTLVLGDAAAGLTGRLQVDTEDGAEIVVDGESRGAAPLAEPLAGLAIGVHDVLVRKDGFTERQTSVAVAADETAYASVPLEALPFYAQGWFWGTVAAASAGVLVASASVTAFVVAASIPLPPKTIDVKGELPAAAQGLDAAGGAQ